jgi:uncharacterized membrane protein
LYVQWRPVDALLFDVEDGLTEIRDTEGLELNSVAAAKAEALKTLPDIAKEKPPQGEQRVIAIHVRDDTGQAVLRTSLTLAVEQVQRS